MKYNELFTHIKEISYTKSGASLDWCVELDDNSKIVRLLFQESNGATDWYHNLAYFSKVYKKQQSVIRAHHGFAQEYKSANNIVMDHLITQIKSHPDYKVVVCGWSNGGAMAQLAAEDLNFRTRTDKNDVNTGVKPILVTFGSPKVFVGKKSKEYVYSCCSKVIQIANHNDIVTYMPPFPWFMHILLPKRARVGEPLSIKKIFNPKKFHTCYDEIELYCVDGHLDLEDV